MTVTETIVPALLAPTSAPVLARSSPHVMRLDAFRGRFGGSARRRELIAKLEAELGHLRSNGIAISCLLVGGGFVRHGEAPGDLDALVVYALDAGSDVEAAGLLLKRKVDGLDLRYVPGDVGPALLIRMSCFFHTLYQSRDRHGDQASFLITMEM